MWHDPVACGCILRRDEVVSVAISPCGTKLVSGGGNQEWKMDPRYFDFGDCDIRVWSMEREHASQARRLMSEFLPAC